MKSGEGTRLISVRTVSLRFGRTVALDGVSLDVEQGEFVAIIGPSGSGKSSLLRILSGVEVASTGCVEYADPLIGCRGIVMVWQSLGLFPNMNVADNVAFGLRVRHVPASVIQERRAKMLALMGLEGYENRSIRELSGGEQQRVAIARALIVEPSVLLLDEPFGALDAHLRDQLQLEIRRLHDQLRLTTIMVTHNQDEAMALASRIVVLNNGRIEQHGTPDEVYDCPRSAFVARFVGRKNVLTGKIAGIRGDDGYVVIGTRAGEFRARVSGEVQRYIGVPAVYVIDSARVRFGNDADNAVTGRVMTIQRSGAVELLHIEVGATIFMWQRITESGPALNVSDVVAVCWSSDDARILPA